MMARHHQEYGIFRIGNPNLNLHLPFIFTATFRDMMQLKDHMDPTFANKHEIQLLLVKDPNG